MYKNCRDMISDKSELLLVIKQIKSYLLHAIESRLKCVEAYSCSWVIKFLLYLNALSYH